MKVTELPKGHEYVMNKEELQAFAQAVINDYKASLCEMTHVIVYDDDKGMDRPFKLKSSLYALPSGETK